MIITLNNVSEPIDIKDDKISVAELLELKKFTYKMLIVKVNGKSIKKEEYPSAFISSGDNVQVIHLMSGG